MEIRVHVHPRAHQTAIRGWVGDVLHISIHANPTENEANFELLRFLSTVCGIPKTSLTIVKGSRARLKTVSCAYSQWDQPLREKSFTGS